MPGGRAERACLLAVVACGVVLARPASAAGLAPPYPIVDHVVRHLPAGLDDGGFEGDIYVHAGDTLNPDAIRDSIESLYATGHFSDVVVSALRPPDGGAATVIFDLIAEERIQHMTFLGAPSFSRDELTHAALEGLVPVHGLGATAGLPAPFYPEELETLQRALEQALDRRGYASAHVSAHVEPIDAVNIDVQFNIDEGVPTRISSLTLTGDPGLPVEQLLPSDFMRVGDILDLDALSRALDALRAQYQQGNFYRAKVEAPQIVRSPDGLRAAVAIPVEAGPVMTFAFRGNRTFSDAELRPRLELTADEAIDTDAEQTLAHKVQRFYVLSGFDDARVRAEELWSLDRRHLTVLFDVDEGLPLRVTSRTFVGAEHFSESFLLDRLGESLQAMVPAPPDVGRLPLQESASALRASDAHGHVEEYRVDPDSVYADEPYQDAANRIRALYVADGYLDASVAVAAVEIDDAHRTAAVTLRVAEGEVTHVGKVTLLRFPPGRTPEMVAGAVHPGQPFSDLAEETARSLLERQLQDRGYLFATVTASDSERTPDRPTTKDIIFEANPGPQVHVRRILLRGNTRTREGIIDAALELKEGDIFDPMRMEATQRNLLRLGIFSHVTVEPLDRDHVDAEKDLLVTVEEKPTIELTHGPGLSLVDGPRYTVDLAFNDVQGQGFNIVIQGKVDYFNLSYPVLSGLDGLKFQSPPYLGIGGNGNVGLRSLGIFNLPVDAHLDVVGQREQRPAFTFGTAALLMGLDWHIVPALTASLNVSPFEIDSIYLQETYAQIITAGGGVSPAELQDLRLATGDTYLWTVTPALTLDLRDNATQPHKGFLASANAELANSLFDDQQTDPIHFLFYVKPTVLLKGYVPLGKMTLGLTASAGRVLPLADGSNTPATKKFFLGGATTMRGYAVDGLIPEDDRAEYHQEVESCRAAITPTGCTDVARVIDQGDQWPSFGGQAFVLYKAEVRFPLFGALEGGIFIDVGDLWDTPPSLDVQLFQIRTLRYTPGVGIHYNTPFGPLSLDFGFNPNPDLLMNETAASLAYLQFSIGQF